MIWALEHVRHNDSEPAGVPPFTYPLLISVLLSSQLTAGGLLAGEKAITERLGALPLSYTNLRSRQDSNLRPPASKAKYLLSTPPAKLNKSQYAHIREQSKRVSERGVYGTLSFGATPRPVNSLLRQRFRSARSLAEEVTRLYHR